MKKYSLGILDLDSVLHIVANKQFKAGNRDNHRATKNNVHTFIETIRKSCQADKTIGFYQVQGHKNFRNVILPEYKGHRVQSEAIACWKPTILEAFAEAGLAGLVYLESDDACSVLAKAVGYDSVVIVSADKDMIQVPCAHFNPFKPVAKPEMRWKYPSIAISRAWFYGQVLAGDSTDMPNSLCGIEGVGMKTAVAKHLFKCESIEDYTKQVQISYTDAYGSRTGYERANRTYKMVRLLNGSNADNYAGANAAAEVQGILKTYTNFLVSPKNDVAKLFAEKYKPSAAELFGL